MRPELVLPASVKRRRLLRQLHRWLGLLVAIQLLFWVSGGLVMSALRLQAVRGEDVASPLVPAALDVGADLLPIGEVLKLPVAGAVTSVTLTTWRDLAVYRIETQNGTELVDATSGRRLSPLTRAAAEAVARADYRGPGRLAGIDWVDTPALEYRGRELPLWRARFDDARNTTLYVSAQSGAVVARRNDLWRVFDFFWMLHVMDYREREDFNHPLLVGTAATAMLFVLSGLAMLVYSFKPRRNRV